MKNFSKLIYQELFYKINGILFAVHNKSGRFCNEQQYCDAIEQCLREFGLEYKREVVLPPSFASEAKGRNKVDFIVDDKIILEIKAKRFLGSDDYYQIKRYLTALNKKLGIIVNFRKKFIQPKRILNSHAKE